MRNQKNDADRISVLEAVVFSDFFSAMEKANYAGMKEAEQRLYALMQGGNASEEMVRQAYFRMFYQMELKEAYMSNSEKFAQKIYEGLCDLRTPDEFHAEYLKRLRQNEALRSRNYSEAVRSTMHHIQDELGNENLSIQMLADYVYLTPNYLASIFKKETGLTIGQYCLQQRIERAKQLLSNGKMKLNQIAHIVGYQDANYFTKIFKREVGCIPSEYREQNWRR